MAENKKSQTQVVAELLSLIEEKLKVETKGTLGNYIRLVQLQKEIEEVDPRDIKVGWVDKLQDDKVEESDKLEKDSGPSSS